MRLIENAGREFHRLWTIRVSLWFGIFTGLAAGLNAFVDVLNPYLFLALSVVVNVPRQDAPAKTYLGLPPLEDRP